MDEKNNTRQSSQQEGQNPTLNQPGSQVADYGNPTGGSANEPADGGRQGGENRSGSAGEEGQETLGNP